jgi:hypothetical protein
MRLTKQEIQLDGKKRIFVTVNDLSERFEFSKNKLKEDEADVRISTLN